MRKSIRSLDSMMNEIGSVANTGSRLGSRLTTRGSSRNTNRSQSPVKPLSPLKIALIPKDSSAGKKEGKYEMLASGIRRSSRGAGHNVESASVISQTLPPLKGITKKTKAPKQRIIIAAMNPSIIHDPKQSLIVPVRKASIVKESKQKIVRNSSIVKEESAVSQGSRKSSMTQIGNRRKSSMMSATSLDTLRKATANNMIQMDESAFEMNDEGVSFSLSSRLRRRQTIVLEENVISKEANVTLNEHDGHKRKFRHMSKILNNIAIIQDPVEEQSLKTPDSKSGVVSTEALSKNVNDGTQTSTYSAHVLDDTSSKKHIKAFAATVLKKPAAKTESNNVFKPPPPGEILIINDRCVYGNHGSSKVNVFSFSFSIKEPDSLWAV